MEDRGSWYFGQEFAAVISWPFPISSTLPVVPGYSFPSQNLQRIPGAFPAGVVTRGGGNCRWSFGNSVGCPDCGEGELLASSGWGLGTLLNIPQHTGWPPTLPPQGMIQPQMPTAPRCRNAGLCVCKSPAQLEGVYCKLISWGLDGMRSLKPY